MSSQALQKARRTALSPLGSGFKTSPLSGPIKATQVFNLTTVASLVQEDQVHLKTKRSSSDRMQSGSPNRDRKSATDAAGIVRKSRSVDAVTSNSYLNGEWPRADPLVAQAYFCPSNLTSDRSTQTPQEWCHRLSSKSSKLEFSNRSPSVVSTDSLKTIRACLTGSSRDSTRHMGAWAVRLALPSKPMAVSELQRNEAFFRSSPDSFSQEIEKLAVAANFSCPVEVKLLPNGRCAPIAEQLKMCSAVTQTPSQFILGKDSNGSSENLRLAPDYDNTSQDDFSTKESGSPELVRFASLHSLTDRLAPEGCEKVCGKFQEINKINELAAELTSPVKMPLSICHIPSESSAFNPPLVKNYLNQPTRMAKKMNNV